MKVCNCKSLSELFFHETRTYDDGKCYFCGHYALDGRETIPNGDYATYLKSRWRDGPFSMSSRRRKSSKSTTQYKLTLHRLQTYDKLRNEGVKIKDIALKLGISVRSLTKLREYWKDREDEWKGVLN